MTDAATATVAPETATVALMSEADKDQQLARLQNINASLERRLKAALDNTDKRREVMGDLIEEALEQKMPDGFDVEAAFDRLVTLISCDDDEAWLLEEDYTVTYKVTLTVKGTVRAGSEEAAKEKLRDGAPTFEISDEDALSGAYIDTVTEANLWAERS